MSSEAFGTAEVRPVPEAIWYHWIVWYWLPGRDKTEQSRRFHDRDKAIASAENWIKNPVRYVSG